MLRGPWGALTWHADADPAARGGPRSHDHRGRVVVWHPPPTGGPAALDVESLDRPLDPGLPRRMGAGGDAEFLARWTVAEVLAKLTGTPMPLWLSRHGLPPAVAPGRARVEVGGAVADIWHLFALGQNSVVTCGSLIPAGIATPRPTGPGA